MQNVDKSNLEKFMLHREDSALLIIDIQERLAAAMSEREKVVENNLHLIELAKMLDIPIILTEQYPKGLGPTVPEIKDAMSTYSPIEKLTFNCCGEPDFLKKFEPLKRTKIIVTGMETHICVLQTCLGLLKADRAVHVVSDAICSRTKENWQVGLGIMQNAGAVVTGTETVLFQLLGVAGTEEFKAVSKRIK